MRDGNQVWTGHIGIFTAKDAKKASQSNVCKPPRMWNPKTSRVSDPKLWLKSAVMSVVPASTYIATIATSIRTEPKKV